MTYIEIARWFGIVSVLLSLGILFNLEDAKAMAKNMVQQESGYIMGGVQPIIFGSYAFTMNHPFEMGWPLVVSVISIMMICMGAYRVFFVQHWKCLMQKHIDKIPPLFSLFGLIFGLLLLYIGFVSFHVSYELALLDI